MSRFFSAKKSNMLNKMLTLIINLHTFLLICSSKNLLVHQEHIHKQIILLILVSTLLDNKLML